VQLSQVTDLGPFLWLLWSGFSLGRSPFDVSVQAIDKLPEAPLRDALGSMSRALKEAFELQGHEGKELKKVDSAKKEVCSPSRLKTSLLLLTSCPRVMRHRAASTQR